MATDVVVLLNACIHTCVYSYVFIISDVMLQPVLVHVCMYVLIGNRAVPKSRFFLFCCCCCCCCCFFHVERDDFCCVLFLPVDGLGVAVDSANCVQIEGVVLIATLCWYHASDFVGRFSCVMFCNDVLVS